MPRLIGNRYFLTAFFPSSVQNVAPACWRHPLPEPVLVLSFPVGWLKCSLHDIRCFEAAKVVIFSDIQSFLSKKKTLRTTHQCCTLPPVCLRIPAQRWGPLLSGRSSHLACYYFVPVWLASRSSCEVSKRPILRAKPQNLLWGSVVQFFRG